MPEYCCEMLALYLPTIDCDEHDGGWCSDQVIAKFENSGVCGLPVHDGGKSLIEIKHCPFCGYKLSKLGIA